MWRGKEINKKVKSKARPRIPKAKKSDVSHWKGITPDPENNLGFIYLITNKATGKKYIGKKQYWAAKQGVKGCRSKVTDAQSPKWKPCCWNESNWKTYMGSSKSLTADIKSFGKTQFTFEILKNCRSKGVLTYAEIEEQVMRGVMWELLSNQLDSCGKPIYAYYNMQVAACRFRPVEYHLYSSLGDLC